MDAMAPDPLDGYRAIWARKPTLRTFEMIGLYLQGQTLRAVCDPASMPLRRHKAQAAVRRLAATVTPGYHGSCWGYPFDWETRYGSVPAGTPTIVATGMIANGLWTAHLGLGLQQAADLLVSAADFVMHDLPRIGSGRDSFCWGYTPSSQQAVLNATVKGSRLLAQAHTLRGGPGLLDAAARSVRFVVDHQLPSGAWPYS